MAVLAPLVLLDLDVYSVASRKSTSTTTTDTELATDSQKMERFPKTSQTDRCLWSVLPLSSGVAESGVWRLEVGDRENACKATKLHQHRLGTLAAIKKKQPLSLALVVRLLLRGKHFTVCQPSLSSVSIQAIEFTGCA